MHIIESITKTIRKHSMLKGDETILVGLSGGPDSVCLAVALRRIFPELKLKAAYIDHGMRPEETPAEIVLCQRLCEQLGADFFTRPINVDEFSKKEKLNLQEAARRLRYSELEYIALTTDSSLIALGHNLDDQCETFFMRVLRGSGPKGLSGIPPKRNKIIRPLIGTSRQEIEEFLKSEKTDFVTDSSNLKEDYLRNRLRSTLMPVLSDINPNILGTVSRTCEILNEEERYFFITVTKKLMTLITRKTDSAIEMFTGPFETLDRAIARRVIRRALEETRGLRAIGLDHIEDILLLAMRGKAGDSLDLPGGLTAYKKYSTFVITSDKPLRLSDYTLGEEGSVELSETRKKLRASLVDKEEAGRIMASPNKLRTVLDADKTPFPLSIRSRQDGDYFYPLGFGKRKKMQDLLVDEKVPRFERDEVPVVLSGNKIAWVAGCRADDRFGPSDKTERFLLLELI
jgi:tRNA(Ile)-lysidine synthase